jgi:hypothetical protein
MLNMATVSTARKISIGARIAAKQASRYRLVRATIQASRATFASLGRVLHLLWLEITGFFFLAFALIGGIALIHEYPKYQAGKVGPGKLVAAACFLVLFAYFGVTSFWRVRRKS